MSEIKTGGPAFPQNTKIVAAAGQELHQGFMGGMTLRDYFAIRAFQTRLAKYNDWTLDQLTEQAYMDADAMLAARSST